MTFKNLDHWVERFPALRPVIDMQPTMWLNDRKKLIKDAAGFAVSESDMEEARAFMIQYAPYIARVFPSTASTKGIIYSPLQDIENFKRYNEHSDIPGRLLLKRDDSLPVAGSIKARGGFFEVLRFAHKLAVKEGLVAYGGVADFTSAPMKKLFSKYTIGVGSTGNLGMSIGIISAKLGFHVNVYMSRDARQWKKNRLLENGANVIEEPGDFGVAIQRGRAETIANPYGYFVDDENSRQLFLGYSLAAFELQQQLSERGIKINADHPLFVYSPCGVGGSPGGVLFGLKMLYGDAVHGFFAEPTHAPSVLLGLITGKKEKVSVHDFGIDNVTEADGLAVGRPSVFASGIIKKLVSGIYTVEDHTLVSLVKKLYDAEGIFVEPSATAGLPGPEKVLSTDYCDRHHIAPANITHVAWSTGGGLVPESVRVAYLKATSAVW